MEIKVIVKDDTFALEHKGMTRHEANELILELAERIQEQDHLMIDEDLDE